jgi:hypothetical protein
MQEVCTYRIEIQGQLEEKNFYTMSPYRLSEVRAGPDATNMGLCFYPFSAKDKPSYLCFRRLFYMWFRSSPGSAMNLGKWNDLIELTYEQFVERGENPWLIFCLAYSWCCTAWSICCTLDKAPAFSSSKLEWFGRMERGHSQDFLEMLRPEIWRVFA